MIEKTEKEIMENWKTSGQLIVSIVSFTYNHENYVTDALDSFLMQETNFPFEVIIRDDCSTDQTITIIKKYVNKFPNIITPIFEIENQYSLGKMGMPGVLRKAQGKYIAICEGDDYWIDKYKLQKQVDFLEKNKNVALLFTNAVNHYYDEENKSIINKNDFNKTLQSGYIKPAAILEDWIVPTATIMYKNIDTGDFLTEKNDFPVGDTPLFLYLAQYGKVYYLNEKTAIYRRLSTGMVRSGTRHPSIEKSIQFIRYYEFLDEYFKDYDLAPIVEKLVSDRYFGIAKISFYQKDYLSCLKYLNISLFRDPLNFFKNITRVFKKKD